MSGGMIRRSMPYGALFLVSVLMLACSSAAATDGSRFSGDQQPGEPPAAAPATAAPAPAPEGDQSGAVPADAGLYIVRTGSLEVEVTDVDAAVGKGRDLVAAIGGYVSASNETTKGDQHMATITYRIPVDHWQDTITALRALGSRVIGETTQADEVTAQVVDLNARIDNLRTSETSLREIMARAGTIDDVLNVQSRLQSVEEDIERLTAQQQDLTGRAALGTLAVTWETPGIPAVQEVQSGWNLGREIDHALAQTVNAGQALASLLIWLIIVGVPVFGPVVLILLLFVWFGRRWQRKHPRPVYAGWQPVPTGYTPPAPAGWYPGTPEAPSAEESAGEGPEDDSTPDGAGTA